MSPLMIMLVIWIHRSWGNYDESSNVFRCEVLRPNMATLLERGVVSFNPMLSQNFLLGKV